MLVQEYLEKTAAATPGRVALVSGEERLTYGQIESQANRLSYRLREAGVERGDRVAIFLESTPEAAISVFGVLKAGATFMVVHPFTKGARFQAIIEDAKPVALISDSPRMRDISHLLPGSPSLRCAMWVDDSPPEGLSGDLALRWSDLAGCPDSAIPCRSIDLDVGTLIYTSGSTGQPKGVISTHANMVAATESINAYLQNTPDDVILDVLPLAFGYGLYQLFLAFGVGARVVLEKGFGFPARVVTVLEHEGITALPGVPTLYALLLRYPDLLKRHLPHLRYMTNAAAAIPVAHIQQITAAWPGVRFFSMYGQTECARISYLPPEQLGVRPSSVGIAIPNTEVFIVDEGDVPVEPGGTGELVVRGSHVARGYWRAPALTDAKFRQGLLPNERVLYTGDLFRTDEDGYLYFVSRKDDIIKSRGEKVSPREVENTVSHLEGISESVVLGMPDPILGEAVRLVVVLREGASLSEREIRAYCARNLDDYMVPKYIEIVSELPRTPNGKIDKAQLRG